MIPITGGAAVAESASLLNDMIGLGPVILLFFAAMAVLIIEAMTRDQERWHLAALSSLAILGALALVVDTSGSTTIFSGMVSLDAYGRFFSVVFGISGLLVVLLSPDYLKKIGVEFGEYYSLVLFSLMGMFLMATANDLMLIFVALEIMSIAMYILAAIRRDNPKSVESGVKYFILGAFSSAIFLYGIAFVFGATATTNLSEIGQVIASGEAGSTLLVGVGLMLVGFAFKIGSVPFHMWVPDVYEGAPTTVTALMATGVKAASFAAFGRVLLSAFPAISEEWVYVIWIISAATMVLGNVAALVQNDLKRMLAFSSVGHAGFALMALVAFDGASAMLFYLFGYTFMTLGAFAILGMIDGDDGSTDISSLDGLASRHPWLAAGLSLVLLSLAGIPPTIGFVGKFSLFVAAINGGFVVLAIIGALSGAVGVYYYLRPIIAMYMKEPEGASVIVVSRAANLVVGLACAVIVVFGLLPELIMPMCREGIAALTGIAI
jgi:NADH-quinone oxidoreductase subunit N